MEPLLKQFENNLKHIISNDLYQWFRHIESDHNLYLDIGNIDDTQKRSFYSEYIDV